MTRDQTIALFQKCLDVQMRVSIERGEPSPMAQDAAAKVWNAWALQQMARRPDPHQNFSDYMKWLDPATVDFSNCDFRLKGKGKAPRRAKKSKKRTVILIESDWRIDFSDFIFPGPAIFSNCRFVDEVTFQQCRFEDRSDFEKSRFFERVIFRGCNFSGYVGFGESNFRKDCDFSLSTFVHGAGFESCTFRKDVNFSECLFKGTATFTGSTFRLSALFSETEFGSDVSFFDATFYAADFGKSQFRESANFANIRIKHEADFRSSVFGGAL